MTNLIICDIDGTVCDISHRIHHLRKDPQDWVSFKQGYEHDAPINAIIEMVLTLWTDGYEIIFLTGRSEHERLNTKLWFMEHFMNPVNLYMRPEGDHRPDIEYKKAALQQIREDFPLHNIAFAIEDRSSVAKLWRDEGLLCHQCAEGDY